MNKSKFDKDFEKMDKAIWFVWYLAIAIILAVLVGGGFMVFKVLAFFSIL